MLIAPSPLLDLALKMTFKSTVSSLSKSLYVLSLLFVTFDVFGDGAQVMHGQDADASKSKLDEQEEVRLEKDGYDANKIQLLSHSTKLKRLRIVNATVTDEELLLIAKIAQLELLDLSGCNQVTDAGVSHLAKLGKLKNLSLGNPSITDTSLETICQLPALAALTMQGCTIRGPGLVHLGKLTKLKEFGLLNSMGGDIALDSISSGEIVKLKMRASGVTQKGLKENLKRFPKLKSLDLGENQIDDTSISLLAATKRTLCPSEPV